MDIAKVDGESFSSDDLVVWLKFSGRFGQVIEDFIKQQVTACAARKAGCKVTPQELQEHADLTRRALGLHRAAETNAFLDDSGLSLAQFEAYLSTQLLSEKMRAEVQSDAAVQAHFKLHAPDFDAVDISHIVVADAEQAEELVALIREGEESFADLACQYSRSETARLGGHIGKVYRGQLGADLEKVIFSASEGQPLGPFPIVNSGTFEIFMVNERAAASLDATARAGIEARLYNEWLAAQARALSVQV